MIVATAGHVDHGKTSLIKQLTGVDTDRLEEEKRRGLSINLGYAYYPVEGASPIGFIDVPGHRRFINTMISGVGSIDLGLLVVAADDGPMPQTVEHLDVMHLLGVEYYVLVLTKTDRVEHDRIDEVEMLSLALLQERGLTEQQVFRVSNHTGEGIADLQQFLVQREQQRQARELGGYFRVSIDRSFNLKGSGLVVTGTATAGTVSVGDQLRLLPQDKTVRVRSIHVQDQESQSAQAGQRCALNIAGDVEKADIARGDWLLASPAAAVTQRIDARLSLLPGLAFSLRHLSPIRIHLGARRVPGKVYLLGETRRGNTLQAGEDCLVQLILDEPLSCVVGERFLLRDDSESVTLGGGKVLDPRAPRSGKARPARLEFLRAMAREDAAAALAELVASGQLIDFSRFQDSWNLLPEEADGLKTPAVHQFNDHNRDWLLEESSWQARQSQLLAEVNAWQDRHPDQLGIKVTDLRKQLKLTLESVLLKAVLGELLQRGELNLREGVVALKGRSAAVASESDQRWQKICELLQQRGLEVPLMSQIVEATGFEARKVESALRTAVREQRAVKINETRHALPETVKALADIVLAMVADDESLTVVNYKGRVGSGRKLAIEVLEYFDTIRFTQRDGDVRTVLAAALPRS